MKQFGSRSPTSSRARSRRDLGEGIDGAPALREAIGPEMNDLYGAKLDRLAAMAQKLGEGGLPPDAVAKVILHALTASRPKARYVVGGEAKVTAALRTYLPKRVFDRIASGGSASAGARAPWTVRVVVATLPVAPRRWRSASPGGPTSAS